MYVERIRNADAAVLERFTKKDGFPIQWTTASMAVVRGSVDQIELRQLNYPTSPGSTYLGPTSSVPIPVEGIAYITGEPKMPQLRARVVQPPEGATSVEWSLAITSERTERGNRDNVGLPAVDLGLNLTWAIDDALLASGVPFVGGQCVITYRFKNESGYVGESQHWKFLIRGKNPTDSAAKAYIGISSSLPGPVRKMR